MSSEANPIETATLTELIEMGEKALEVRCGDAFSATDPLDGEWIPEIQRYLNKAGDAAVPLAEEVLMLRGVLREVLASGTESMTTNYRVVKIDHQTWSDAQEAIGAQ